MSLSPIIESIEFENKTGSKRNKHIIKINHEISHNLSGATQTLIEKSPEQIPLIFLKSEVNGYKINIAVSFIWNIYRTEDPKIDSLLKRILNKISDNIHSKDIEDMYNKSLLLEFDGDLSQLTSTFKNILIKWYDNSLIHYEWDTDLKSYFKQIINKDFWTEPEKKISIKDLPPINEDLDPE